MAKIKVALNGVLTDGMSVKFKAPCDSLEVDGLTVSRMVHDGTKYEEKTDDFTFRDSLGHDLTGVGSLFSSGSVVKAILDVPNKSAYLLNSEGRLMPVGSIYITSTMEDNPETRFGGKWELVGKEFKDYKDMFYSEEMSPGDYFTVADGVGVTLDSISINRVGRTVTVDATFLCPDGFSLTSGVHGDIGVFNWKALGITLYGDIHQGVSFNRINKSAIIGWSVSNDSLSVDCVYGAELTTALDLQFTIHCGNSRMLNAFCDKFYWKRLS